MSSIIKHERVRLGRESGDPSDARTSGTRCSKSLRVARVEGKVRAVEVACSCGEVTVIELDYAERQESA